MHEKHTGNIIIIIIICGWTQTIGNYDYEICWQGTLIYFLKLQKVGSEHGNRSDATP